MAKDTELAENTLRGRLWNTLPKRSEFLRISATGVRRVTPGFILQTAPKGDTETRIRVGFTASRKVGNAVARNRVKRRLRALADKAMPNAADPARDYVFIGRTETLTIAFAVLERDLRKALAKLAGQAS